MRFLVGLGNPGERYLLTRHNAGAIVVDLIARDLGLTLGRRNFDSQYAEGILFGEKFVLIKPMTYMNLSGQAVQRWKQYYKIPGSRLIVVHDDIDLASGKVKMRKGGGHGGHNGIRNIVELTGDSDFYRIKLGVGKPTASSAERREKMSSWVLAPFEDSELTVFREEMLPEVMLRLREIVRKED